MRHFVLLCLSAACCLGCGSSPPATQTANTTANAPMQSLREVQLQLNWFPEAEHGGYYAALVHGFYEQEGLQVTIRPGGPGIPVTAQVASGQVAFGITNAQNVLLGNAEQAHTVAVMAPLQHSPRCIMVHEKSGIRDFASLQNVTLAMNSSSPFSLYLQKKVPLTGVKIVPYPGNVAQFLLQQDFAQQGYVFSEIFVAKQQGGDPYPLMVSDLGFDPYTSVLITHPDTIAGDSDLVQRMVRASIRGWQKYLQDSVVTNTRIHDANEDMDLEILQYGAEQQRPLCLDDSTPESQLGRMTAQRWQTLLEQLIEAEAVEPDAVQSADAFTDRFLQPQ